MGTPYLRTKEGISSIWQSSINDTNMEYFRTLGGKVTRRPLDKFVLQQFLGVAAEFLIAEGRKIT